VTCKTPGLRVDPRLRVQLELIETAGTRHAEESRIACPPLTTIRQPLQEMGATAAEILLRKLAKGEVVEDIRQRPELIMRSSICPPYVASLNGAQALASKRARQAKSGRVIHRSMGCHTIVLDVSSSLTSSTDAIADCVIRL
jgi:hypothetical protein